MEGTDLDPEAMQIASLREVAKQLEEELKEKEESFQAFKKKTKLKGQEEALANERKTAEEALKEVERLNGLLNQGDPSSSPEVRDALAKKEQELEKVKDDSRQEILSKKCRITLLPDNFSRRPLKRRKKLSKG
eukprot:529353-Hanusia_phi.AAC.1